MNTRFRKLHRSLSLLLVAWAMAGCSTVHTHLVPAELRPEKVRGVYRGAKQVCITTHGLATSKEPKARAWFAAVCPLMACDFVLSAVADTVLLPYDALAKDGSTACKNAGAPATQPMNTQPDHQSQVVRRVR